jgi:SAM-dependent methyltransferase
MDELYDSIGHGYRRRRQPDPHIAQAITTALAGAESVINVGAGTGSYEPADRFVVAVEPSLTMIRQRTAEAGPAVRAYASDLPFADASCDAAMALLTMHHWPDWRRGVRELVRVARQRVVIFTWDPACAGFWLVYDYFPEIIEMDRPIFPSFAELDDALGGATMSSVPVPHDCTDGFLGAYWRRPSAYLDADVRAAISGFSKLTDVDPVLRRLQRDVSSGEWQRRNAALLERDSLDLGYRLVIAEIR